MNLTNQITIPVQMIARKVGDEMVILELPSVAYFGFEPVAARLWQLITEGRTLAGVCDVLPDEFEATRKFLKADVQRLITELQVNALVVVS